MSGVRCYGLRDRVKSSGSGSQRYKSNLGLVTLDLALL